MKYPIAAAITKLIFLKKIIKKNYFDETSSLCNWNVYKAARADFSKMFQQIWLIAQESFLSTNNARIQKPSQSSLFQAPFPTLINFLIIKFHEHLRMKGLWFEIGKIAFYCNEMQNFYNFNPNSCEKRGVLLTPGLWIHYIFLLVLLCCFYF
jgi:hypothetical protein